MWTYLRLSEKEMPVRTELPCISISVPAVSMTADCRTLQDVPLLTRRNTVVSSCLCNAGSQHSIKLSNVQRPGSNIRGCFFEPWHSLTRWQFTHRRDRTRSPYRHRHVHEAILRFGNLLRLRSNDASVSFFFNIRSFIISIYMCVCVCVCVCVCICIYTWMYSYIPLSTYVAFLREDIRPHVDAILLQLSLYCIFAPYCLKIHFNSIFLTVLRVKILWLGSPYVLQYSPVLS